MLGAGGEFATEENFTLIRAGLEYGWELGISLMNDFKIDAYDSWVLGLVFGGLDKAATKGEGLFDAETIYSGGGGFRYLIARAFKIRSGIDVAIGSGGWGYYIVFGHNWNR